MRLFAEKGDLAEVRCHYADKYETGGELVLPLAREASDGILDYWTAVLSMSTSRLRYIFELRFASGETRFLTEYGFVDAAPRWKHYAGYFFYPYDLPVDRFAMPSWVAGTTFYLVFPDRFANGDRSNDPAWVRPWGEAPTNDSFFGGDIAGIRQRLGWLSDLGVSGLYLTPVFASPSNHKYDPEDYERVDPGLGTNDDLAALVRDAHARGMRVVLDGVFNHSGDRWFAFRDVRERGEASPYRDWFFRIDSFPVDVDAVNYETFANRARSHPKLNTANPELRDYLVGIGERWIREADIDGWRLDVANEVDHRFWRAFRDRVKAAKPDAFIVGEAWHDAIRWLDGAQFDSVMHYPWRDAVIRYLTGQTATSGFAQRTTAIRHMYDAAATPGLMHLLGSHDTARIRSELGGSADRARQAAVLLLTATGAPLVCYGDEVGLEGGEDPDSRRCMEWDRAKQELHILHAYRTLIHARRSRPWLAWGAFDDIVVDDERHVYAYRRTSTGPLAPDGARYDVMYVALNTGTFPSEVCLGEETAPLVDLLSGKPATSRIMLDPAGAAVLVPA
ncbi:MAG: alpha-glycosidase [Chloroflexi bacterium]|nr:MAG: alpha-glycosidase [Chloroflexota bacterium]